MFIWKFYVVACKNSTFSQAHKVGNNGINANFVFPYIYICSFLHYLDLKMLVNVKLDLVQVGKIDYLSKFQTLLAF